MAVSALLLSLHSQLANIAPTRQVIPPAHFHGEYHVDRVFAFGPLQRHAATQAAAGHQLSALPDGTTATSQQSDLNEILSKALKRQVTPNATERGHVRPANAEEYWPDMEGLDYRDTVTDFALPEGTFFDCAAVHVLTTATIDRLRELYPKGRFEARRFRPNIVVQPVDDVKDFIENGWIDHALAIGDEVRLSITGGCPRCVMTTLAQGDLPKDPGILRTAAQHNHVNVGVYAAVSRGGTIRRGDPVRLE